MLYYDMYSSPIGHLKIVASNEGIREISLQNEKIKINPNEYTMLAKKQLDAYFHHQLQKFDLPLDLVGSDFSKKVYKKMQEIPYGQVVSYKQLALSIGSSKAYRAIGHACHTNPCLIIIPCHRVVASDYALRGFRIGLEIKSYLLEFEGMSCLDGRVVV